jgi:hypothetical protein
MRPTFIFSRDLLLGRSRRGQDVPGRPPEHHYALQLGRQLESEIVQICKSGYRFKLAGSSGIRGFSSHLAVLAQVLRRNHTRVGCIPTSWPQW